MFRRRRSFVLLALAAAVLGMGAMSPVKAQDAAAPITGEQLFGTYELEARGLGVQTVYELVGLLPGGAKVLDLTIPETLARFGSGPTGYGLASLAYPGGIVVNLGSLVAQVGADASNIPEWPLKAEAFFPAGPVAAGDPSSGQLVESNELGVQSTGTFPAVNAAPLVSVGSITSSSRASIEDGKAVARSRVELGAVSILGGLIAIDSLVTDLVAVHDGTTGAADGGTEATGVRFLGLAASLTQDGLVLAPAPPTQGVGGPLGELLNPLLGPLNELTAPVRNLLQQVLRQAVPQVNDLLAAAGLEIKLLSSEEVVNTSGASGRAASGLSVTLTYLGKEQENLLDLINSLPDELKPGLGPIPNPITFLAENHIMGVTLGSATVSALASPPFDTSFEAPGELPFDPGEVVPGTFDPGSVPAPAFGTPTPDLPGPAPLDDGLAAAADNAVPAAAIVLMLLAAPFLGIGSTRLADNVLAPVSTSCPSGLDKPPPPSRPS